MKRRINSVKPPESNTTDNYIDDDSEWLYNESRGTKLYGFYSRTNTENPVLLYASAEEQAVFKFLEPGKIAKELADGSNRRFETLDKWVGAYGLLKNGNHSDMHKELYTPEKQFRMMDWMAENLDTSPAQLLSAVSRISPMEEFEN